VSAIVVSAIPAPVPLPPVVALFPLLSVVLTAAGAVVVSVVLLLLSVLLWQALAVVASIKAVMPYFIIFIFYIF